VSGLVRRCGVIGSPIAHSLSPVLHRAAYRHLDLDWEYDAYDVSERDLEAFIENALIEHWRGLSVTMPLKRRARFLCDQVDDLAERLEAVNTIVIDDKPLRRTMFGYNTDVNGFIDAFGENGVDFIGEVLVVGGGATAAAALAAVRRMGGYRATIAVRDPRRAQFVGDVAYGYGLETRVMRLADIDKIPPAEVVVSTIPADAQGEYADALVERVRAVFDVVYDPLQTPLIEAAERAGKTVINGFDLLLHQAGRQVELMTGVGRAPLDLMRKEGLAALGNR
jgi:shikimate dehydrogenase